MKNCEKIWSCIGKVSVIIALIVGILSGVSYYIDISNNISKKTPLLKCYVKSFSIFKGENYIFPVEIQNPLLEKGYNEIKEYLSQRPYLSIYSIKIKNTGKEDLNYKDLYVADTLKIELGNIVGAVISDKTPVYINATIDKISNGIAYIKFDTIEPNDVIFINAITTTKYSDNLKVTARSKYFERVYPGDYNTAIVMNDPVSAQKLEPKTFKDYVLYLMLIISGVIPCLAFINLFKPKIFDLNLEDINEIEK